MGCPSGYAEKEGDLPGWGTDIGSALDLTRQECAQKCNGEKRCMSFDHSNTQMKCNLNKIPYPSQGPNKDFIFCTKTGRISDQVNVSLSIYIIVANIDINTIILIIVIIIITSRDNRGMSIWL